MKKQKAKSMFLLIAGIVLAVLSLVMLGVADAVDIAIFGLILAAICIVIALVQMSRNSAKNTHVIEAEFTSIGKYGDGWVGCYFNVNGKETRIGIFKEVYNPKLLMPGGKYRLTLRNKDNSVISVERIG